MHRKDELLPFTITLVLTDVVMINLSVLLAYWLRFYSGLISVWYIPPLRAYLGILPFLTFIWLIVFKSLKLYEPRRSVYLVNELFSVFLGASLGSVFTMVTLFLYRGFSYSRLVFVFAWGISVLLIDVSRSLIREVEKRKRKKGIGVRNILIVGAGVLGENLVNKIQSAPRLGYKIVGFLDDDPQKRDFEFQGVKVLGATEGILPLIKKKGVDEVLITFPSTTHRKILKMIMDCEETRVEFKIIPDLLEMITTGVSVDEIAGIPLFGLKEFPLQGWNRLVKRAMDIIFSSLVLIVLSPLMMIVSLLIKSDSRVPVFFKQKRIGRDGREFTIYKFRSMKVGAEEDTGPVWATPDDPRATRVGKFLRKISLDELPQFYNVLKGEMSLVGPRPERPFFVQQFKGAVPRYMVRNKIKSGITGWAQVNGLRGNSSIHERTKYDLHYIENWSLLSDLKILFIGRKSMLQETVERIKPLIKEKDIFISTGTSLFREIRRQLPRIRRENIILEPVGRNTAACLGLAAVTIAKKNPEATMVVLAADHLIEKKERFLEIISKAGKLARKREALITIGIKPLRPDRGYGYIKAGNEVQSLGTKGKIKIYEAERFLEKPDLKTAKKFLKSGKYFWNSGMFVWTCATILEGIAQYMPELARGLKKIERALGTPREEKVKKEVFFPLDKVSIDYGVMERADNVLVIKGDFPWDDVGSWSAMERIYSPDKNKNIVLGSYKGIDTTNSIIISDKGTVGTIGVKDLVIISTEDATLICPKSRTEEVKKLVRELSRDKKLKKYI
jgi:mannose-1-phosphate guanylyltransferase/mannose-6-phosphate isomerase